MIEETLTPQFETEVEETVTPEFETRFQMPSRTRKALIGLLGGLGIFAATNAYGVIAGIHNDRVRDAQAEEIKAEAEEALKFDITRAKIIPLINLDEEKPADNAK